MFTRPQVGVLAAALLAATLHAQDAATGPVGIHTRVIESQVEELLVRGSLELSLENSATSTLGSAQISLLAPSSGVLGDGTGPVDLGDIAFDQTHVQRVDFVLEKTFVDSGEPLLVRITYTDGSGDAREASVATRLKATGGGL